MKNLKKISIVLAAAVLSFTTISCKKDKEAPLASISSPSEHTLYKFGETVHVHATLSDDIELKSYEIEIVDADGNHMHDFNIEKTVEVTGTSVEIEEDFTVPTGAPTVAWISLSVTDAEEKTTPLLWELHFEE